MLIRAIRNFALCALWALGSPAARAEGLADEARFQPWTDPAPPFRLRTLSGAEVRLDDLRGRVVLVHFFATWCAPCRTELPALQQFAAAAGSQHVALVVISVAEPDGRVRRFAESTNLALDVALDSDRAVTRAWNIVALPTTVVLSPGLSPRFGAATDLEWGSVSAGRLIDRARDGGPEPLPIVKQPPGG